MFNFFKKKKLETCTPKETLQPLKSLHDCNLEELLDGNESYKMFYWGFGFKDGRVLRERIIPLKKWTDVEKALDMLEKEYENIESGNLTLKFKDDLKEYSGSEIASIEIQILHGYMKPYMKYRAEGAVEAEEWKEYVGQRPRDENNKPIYDKYFEFGSWDSVPIYNLTKDISLVKTIFKEFYETGDVSEEYMD